MTDDRTTGDHEIGEFELIDRYLKPLAAGFEGAFGLGDDAAVVAPARRDRALIVTTDTMVDGVHCLAGTPADAMAQKLLRINLSDLAAMAAAPFAYNLALALPAAVGAEWLERFAAGLGAAQASWGIHLIGGDTVRTEGPAVLTVSMFGWASAAGPLTRAGARAGDAVYVTGSIGDAELGLRLLKGDLAGAAADDRDYLIGRHRLPTPRLPVAERLLGLATAAIDVSDGVAADLAHICKAATPPLGATIDVAALPLSAPARRVIADGDAAPTPTDLLGAGDDYELLFTCGADRDGEVAAVSARAGVAITRIGAIDAEPGLRAVAADGRPTALAALGYRHF